MTATWYDFRFVLIFFVTACFMTSGVGPAQQAPPPSKPAPLGDASDLPWSAQQPTIDLDGIDSPQEYLETVGIDRSQLDRLFDGRPFVEDEYEPLFKILYRLPRMSRAKFLQWVDQDVTWEEVAENPGDCRADALRIEGRVTSARKREVPQRTAALLGYEDYWEVEMTQSGTNRPIHIYARYAPDAWQGRSDLNEKAHVLGLFLKQGQADEGRAPWHIASARVSWTPQQADPSLGISQDKALLGKLGMDVGLFDTMRDANGKTRRHWNKECFYQLLAAAQNAEGDSLYDLAGGNTPLAPLLQSPKKLQGQLIGVQGTVRRIQEVVIEDPDIVERFGFDRYYEVGLLIPLQNQKVKLGEKGPTITNNFPAIACVTELPPQLEVGEEMYETIRVAGFYYVLWAYRSEFVDRHGEGRQVSPVIIGKAPQWLDMTPRENPYVSVGVGAALVVMVAGIWWWVWKTNTEDAKVNRELRRRHKP